MSCTVKYDNGDISQVLEDGKVSQTFEAIAELVKDRNKAFAIYSRLEEGVSETAKSNIGEVKTSLKRQAVTQQSFTEGKLIMSVAGSVKDYEGRSHRFRTSEQTVSPKEANRIIILQKAIKQLTGINKEALQEKYKELTKGVLTRMNISNNSVRINENNLVLGISSLGGNYGYSLMAQGTPVAMAEVGPDNNLINIDVAGFAQGQALGIQMLSNVIKERSANNQELTIDKKDFKGLERVLDNLVIQGVFTESKGLYTLQSATKGSLGDAITSLGHISEGVTNSQKPSVRNMMYAFNVTSAKEVFNKLSKLKVDGVLNFSRNSLKKVFNTYEVNRIEGNNEIIEEITDLYNRLGATDMEIDFDPKFVVDKSSMVTGGVIEKHNPFKVEADVMMAVAGEQNPFEALPEEYQSVAQTKEGRDYIERVAREYGKPRTMYVTPSGLLKQRKGDTLGKFELILNNRTSEIASRTLDRIDNMDDQQYMDLAYEEIKVALDTVGIDTRNYELRINSAEALSNMESLLVAVENTDFETASEIYDRFLNNESMERTLVRGANNTDIYMEPKHLSEMEIFESYELVKKGPNLYVRAQYMNYETMMELAYNSELNPNDLSIEELADTFYEEALKMGIPGQRRSLIRNYLYKLNGGFELTDNTSTGIAKSVEYIVPNESLIKEYFITDINQYINETGNTDFKITSKGLEFTYTDPVSIQEAIESLPGDLREQITEYSKMSRTMEEIEVSEVTNMSIEEALLYPARTSEVEMVDVGVEERIKAYNFPESLRKLQMPYNRVVVAGQELMVKAKEMSDYLNHNGQTYERVYDQFGLSVFKNSDFTPGHIIDRNITPVTIMGNIDFLNKLSKEVKPTEITNVFDKGEKTQIEEEFFKC